MGGTRKSGIREVKIAYEPLKSQARFHQLTTRFKGFSGPIGSGKSQALCQEAVKLSYLNPGRMGLLGAPTYPMLRDATQRTLLEILARNSIPYELNKAENLLIFKETGSRVVFRALDDFERLRGTNLAWFGVDELTYTPEESWLRLEGRLRDPKAQRLCGFAVWTPKGFDWVYRRFIAEPVEGYGVVLAEPHENRHILEKIPDYYERLRSSYDPKFYAQEVLGEYLESGGDRVYHCFRRAAHVGTVEMDRRLPLCWALDFNVDPMCSVVAQVEGDSVRVLDEIVLERATTAEAFAEFRNRYRKHDAGLRIYGDASGHAMQTTGQSDYRMLKECLVRGGYRNAEFRTLRRNPGVRERIGLVNALLEGADGVTRLTVDRRCRELVKDFEEVVYKPGSLVVDKERDPRRTHLTDALGYLIWREFGKPLTAGERGKPLH
jgi:hypothetical protein